MAEFKTIAIAEIFVSADRVRKVDDNKAFLIGQSVAAGELIHPVTVYRTPNGERPYTLAAGATRYRGHELHGMRVIECLVRKLDKAGARRIEIEENLFRADLTMLERAQHVVEYRRLWEEEHGAVAPGGDKRSQKYHSAKLAEWSSGAQAHFFEQALDDFGLSERAIQRAHTIGKGLQPALQAALRDKPEAKNQRALETLAKLQPQRQALVAAALDQGHDVPAALKHTDPNARAKVTVSLQDEIFGRLIATWDRADEKTKAKFLAHIESKQKAKRERLPEVGEVIGGEARHAA